MNSTMALNTGSISHCQRNSQTFERRRSLFPQNSIDSSDDSDLGCISPLSNSSFDDDDFTSENTNNINDYDVIGIVRREISITPEATPDKDWTSGIPDLSKSAANTPHYKNFQFVSATPSENALSKNYNSHILKTPHDTMSGNCKLPKLIHKSVNESSVSAPSKRKLSPYNSPQVLDNPSKIDIKNSKVRTTLFPELNLFIPTKKFYSSTDSGLEQLKEHKKELNSPIMDQMKKKLSFPGSSLNLKKKSTSKRNSTGRINAGVRHKIRKPKPRRNNSMLLAKTSMNEIQSNALKSYLENLRELKSGNQQILIENKENSSPDVYGPSGSSVDISTPKSALSFTDNHGSSDIKMLNMNEKLTNTTENGLNTVQHFANNNQLDYRSMNSIVTNQSFTNPFTVNFSITNQNSVSTVEDEVSKKRPLSPTVQEPDQTKKFFKFSRGHKGVVTMNKSMKLMVDHGKVSLLGGSAPKKLQHVPDFETEDFAVEEPVMSQVVLDNILSTLDNDSQRNGYENQNHDQSMFSNQCPTNLNFMDPSLPSRSVLPTSTNPENLILSPISQMCDVTSGLALNSPKRVQNLTPLMDTMSRSAKEVSSKTVSDKKKYVSLAQKKIKKLHKDQMLLDAGQKKFGVTQCNECNFVYHIGDMSDEACHNNYHEAVPVLKFGVSEKNIDFI